MAKTFRLDIITPERQVFSGDANSVILPAWEGELGVLPGHDRLLALIKPGRAKVVDESGTRFYSFEQGFSEIGPDSVTVFTDACTDLEAS